MPNKYARLVQQLNAHNVLLIICTGRSPTIINLDRISSVCAWVDHHPISFGLGFSGVDHGEPMRMRCKIEVVDGAHTEDV